MIVQVVKFDIQPTHISLFKALLEDDKQGSKNEAGLLEMRLYQDKNLPNIFFAYERFDNQSAIDHHATQQDTNALHEA
jgi:quinol monooxygenase YgiN